MHSKSAKGLVWETTFWGMLFPVGIQGESQSLELGLEADWLPVLEAQNSLDVFPLHDTCLEGTALNHFQHSSHMKNVAVHCTCNKYIQCVHNVTACCNICIVQNDTESLRSSKCRWSRQEPQLRSLSRKGNSWYHRFCWSVNPLAIAEHGHGTLCFRCRSDLGRIRIE